MNEYEKGVYAEIGLLSTNFATIEHHVQGILARYITQGNDDNMLVGLILDSNSLEQKLQHLEKAILFEFGHIKEARSYIKEVRKFKSLRNSFIHGSWHVSTEPEESTVSVYNNKVKKVYSAFSAGDKDNPGWQMGTETFYTLNELKEINRGVQKIRDTGKDIIEKIDNGDFEFL